MGTYFVTFRCIFFLYARVFQLRCRNQKEGGKPEMGVGNAEGGKSNYFLTSKSLTSDLVT